MGGMQGLGEPVLVGGMSRGVRIALAFAFVLCLARLALFDRAIFTLQAVTNHDSTSSAGAFASSMHALVSEGDLAWWLPSPEGGFAQYYNQFLSPLMPTAGAPLFILWAIAIKALLLLGLRVPEYFQFIFFQQVLSPF